MTAAMCEAIGRSGAWTDRAWPERDGDDAADGPQALFDRVRPFIPHLRRYLLRRVPFADVEDLVQDVLLRVCRRAEGSPVAQPRSYLFQVANAAIVDRHRREASRCASFHCELSDACHPLDELSPLRILLAREDVRATEAALGALPERTREIIIAMRLEGWSLKSLARRYEISTSAIEKHVTRAAKALARQRTDTGASRSQTAPRPIGLEHHI